MSLLEVVVAFRTAIAKTFGQAKVSSDYNSVVNKSVYNGTIGFLAHWHSCGNTIAPPSVRKLYTHNHSFKALKSSYCTVGCQEIKENVVGETPNKKLNVK